jgi:hypothetical protein
MGSSDESENCSSLEASIEPMADTVAVETTSARLIRAMWDYFAEEAREAIRLCKQHIGTYTARCLLPSDQITTTSIEDCAFLYLLIRHFKRRHVFELGTNIGTSAVCMNAAVRRNGGVLTTSDPLDYDGLPPWSGIRFIKGPAKLALYALMCEGHRPDFYFFDWPADAETYDLLARVLSEDAILATHDYYVADPEGAYPKGHEVVAAIERAGLNRGRTWLFPSRAPDVMSDGTRINHCTAVCIPTGLLAEECAGGAR